jgi:hypothetical protein
MDRRAFIGISPRAVGAGSALLADETVRTDGWPAIPGLHQTSAKPASFVWDFAFRMPGSSVLLLLVAMAALTVASLARTASHAPESLATAQYPPVIQKVMLEVQPARHGICLYSTGSEDDTPETPERPAPSQDRAEEQER